MSGERELAQQTGMEEAKGKKQKETRKNRSRSLLLGEGPKGWGFCSNCGCSMYHYQGSVCIGDGSLHPVDKGKKPPPSYADVNG
jgi:hypothetical protein